MLLKALIIIFICVIASLFIIVTASGILTAINKANDLVAQKLNTTPVHKYQSIADSVFVNIAWVATLALAGALLVYMIHIKRR